MDACSLKLLYVSLCFDDKNAQDAESISEICSIYRIRPINNKQIAYAVEEHKPSVICMDYDFPDLQGLQSLRQLRLDYPSIPLVMLTTYHDENLAIFAYESGVRAYKIKPVSENTVKNLLSQLVHCIEIRKVEKDDARKNVISLPSIPKEFRYETRRNSQILTAPAVCFVEANFQAKIMEQDVARACGMSKFKFSRIFRCEHAMTFREYLIRYRIDRARVLLHNPTISVTDVAGMAGFGDCSSFARIFRRYIGVTPSCYRKRHLTSA